MIGDLFEIRADGTVVVRLHVLPAAGRTAVAGTHGDALKVKVAAPPEGGRANEACAALLADVLGVQPAAVELAGGATSRTKRFAVGGVEADEVRRLLTEAVAAAGNKPGRGSVADGRR